MIHSGNLFICSTILKLGLVRQNGFNLDEDEEDWARLWLPRGGPRLGVEVLALVTPLDWGVMELAMLLVCEKDWGRDLLLVRVFEAIFDPWALFAKVEDVRSLPRIGEKDSRSLRNCIQNWRCSERLVWS